MGVGQLSWADGDKGAEEGSPKPREGNTQRVLRALVTTLSELTQSAKTLLNV